MTVSVLRKGPSGPTAEEGVSSFLSLSDTPNSYAGAKGERVSVNDEETGIVFSSPYDFLNSSQWGYISATSRSDTSLDAVGILTGVSSDATSIFSVDGDGNGLTQSIGDNANVYTDAVDTPFRIENNSSCLIKFAIKTTNFERMFVGFVGSVSFNTPLNSDDPSLPLIGVIASAALGETTYRLVAGNDTGPLTRIDTGVPLTTGALHVRVTSDANNSTFKVELLDAKFILLASHLFTSNIPLPGDDVPLGLGAGFRNQSGATQSIIQYFMKVINTP